MDKESALIIATSQIVSTLIKSDKIDITSLDGIKPRDLESLIAAVKEDIQHNFRNL